MFVVDTPVSKKNHDTSMKHQGALKRFLRDLHRTNEREQSAAAAAKREVARLNGIVGGSSSSSATAPFAGPSSAYKQPRAATEEERKRQLKELEALGVALPDEARRELAMVGDWEVATVEEGEEGKEAVVKEIVRLQKRKLEEEERERRWEAMDEDERAMKGFSIQVKTYPGQEELDFDPGVLFKGKGKGKVDGSEAEVKVEVKKEDGESVAKEDTEEVPKIKTEEDEAAVKKEDSEPAVVGDGVVFKKRKVKNIRKK